MAQATPATQNLNAGQSRPILRYPYRQIKQSDDYLKIDIIRYVPPGIETITNQSFALRGTDESLEQSKKNILATIILPIPEGISDTNMASWGEETMNPLEAAGASIASSSIQGGNPADIVKEKLEGIASAGTDATGRKNFGAIGAQLAASALAGNDGNVNSVNSYISRSTGTILNPNTELLFNNVSSVRDFNFSFDMVPRSKRESDEIKNIIRRLKYHMTPSRGNEAKSGGGLFIKAPDVFQLSYMSGPNVHPFLNLFKPTALTGMTVNYTGSGTYATYSDSTPVHMQMSLSFKELSPIFKESYDEYGGATASIANKKYNVGY